MSPWSSRPVRPCRPGRIAAVALLLVTVSACSSMSFTRKSETHGEFYANGVAVTILGIDLPRSAVDIARENLSDARQPNMRVREELVFPYFGVVDWILDIFSIRYASISGTWGFPPASATDGFSN
jgi:hypothetical protein